MVTTMIPEVKAAMFHREIMAATQEFRRLHDETPSVWMSQELYDLLFNDKYYGWHFVENDVLKYFGCPVTVIREINGCQYLVGIGGEEREPDWDQLEEMKAEQEQDLEEDQRWFMETVKRWIDEQKKEMKS